MWADSIDHATVTGVAAWRETLQSERRWERMQRKPTPGVTALDGPDPLRTFRHRKLRDQQEVASLDPEAKWRLRARAQPFGPQFVASSTIASYAWPTGQWALASLPPIAAPPRLPLEPRADSLLLPPPGSTAPVPFGAAARRPQTVAGASLPRPSVPDRCGDYDAPALRSSLSMAHLRAQLAASNAGIDAIEAELSKTVRARMRRRQRQAGATASSSIAIGSP